jgi:carboxymethylenebutenolidase
MAKTWLTSLAAALALAGPGVGLPAIAQDAFVSGGASITVERFGTEGAGDRPAVLLLHGADGPGERYRIAARLVASGGYAVFLIHYLDRTGERRASFNTIGRNLPAWSATIRDAITYAARQPGVDASRIGLFGVSLGGGLALASAAQDDRVRVVIDYFGFAPQALDGAKLPPTLVLHGEQDRVVPVSNAHAVQSILRAHGVPHEVKIYPGEGHGFRGAAQIDAAQRINAFLDRHLGGGTTGAL